MKTNSSKYSTETHSEISNSQTIKNQVNKLYMLPLVFIIDIVITGIVAWEKKK